MPPPNRICNLLLGVSLLGFISNTNVLAAGAASSDNGELAKGFATPPASARPWVYWFPLSGNLSKKGITADFEAMARVGIDGSG